MIGGVLVIACIIAFMVYRRRTGVSGTPTPTEQDVSDFEITRKEDSHIYDRVEDEPVEQNSRKLFCLIYIYIYSFNNMFVKLANINR